MYKSEKSTERGRWPWINKRLLNQKVGPLKGLIKMRNVRFNSDYFEIVVGLLLHEAKSQV